MDQRFDILIIGGGVIGSSVAYHLAMTAGHQVRIAVIERDPTYAQASSSLSTSAIRQQFGTPPNIAMSAAGIRFLRTIGDTLAVDGDRPDIGLREPGYLILGAPEHVAAFRARHQVQRACNVDVELLDPAQLQARHGWLNTDGVGIGSYGPTSEGWFDGPALHQAFRRKARSLGVAYIMDTLTGFDRTGPTLTAARLASGARIGAGTFVNAAGAWSGQVAGMAGVEVPVEPRKRCVFVIDSPARLAHIPFIFDTTGIFVRPEGHLYICGITPPTENAPDDFGMDVDHALFDDLVWPALAHRIPGFEQLRMLRAWAGLYEYNVFDHSSLIGRHPDLANLVLACGFSGHGMMHSPAAGAGVAELIVHGGYRTLDLSAFGIERVRDGRAIAEHVY